MAHALGVEVHLYGGKRNVLDPASQQRIERVLDPPVLPDQRRGGEEGEGQRSRLGRRLRRECGRFPSRSAALLAPTVDGEAVRGHGRAGVGHGRIDALDTGRIGAHALGTGRLGIGRLRTGRLGTGRLQEPVGSARSGSVPAVSHTSVRSDNGRRLTVVDPESPFTPFTPMAPATRSARRSCCRPSGRPTPARNPACRTGRPPRRGSGS